MIFLACLYDWPTFVLEKERRKKEKEEQKSVEKTYNIGRMKKGKSKYFRNFAYKNHFSREY